MSSGVPVQTVTLVSSAGFPPLSQRSHPAGRHKERPPERRRYPEEAEGAEPGAHHPPAGPEPGQAGPGGALHGMLGAEPGRHQGGVRRGGEVLPEPAAHRQQEALRPALRVCSEKCFNLFPLISLDFYPLIRKNAI